MSDAKRKIAKALMKDPEWEYGSLLPIATRGPRKSEGETYGDISLALPDIIRDPLASWTKIRDQGFTNYDMSDVLNVAGMMAPAGLMRGAGLKGAAREAMPSPWSAEIKSLGNSDAYLAKFGEDGPAFDHPFRQEWVDQRIKQIEKSPGFKYEQAQGRTWDKQLAEDEQRRQSMGQRQRLGLSVVGGGKKLRDGSPGMAAIAQALEYGNRPIDMSRPKLDNGDGTFSTERTIGIEADGMFFNIPTIVNGREVSEDDAVYLFFAGKNPPVGVFKTQAEADALLPHEANRSVGLGASPNVHRAPTGPRAHQGPQGRDPASAASDWRLECARSFAGYGAHRRAANGQFHAGGRRDRA